MGIGELDIVTLSDNIDYIVAKKVVSDGNNYYCFVNTDDNESFKFVYEDNNSLVEVEDASTFEKIIHLMGEAINSNELLVALRNKLQAKMNDMYN